MVASTTMLVMLTVMIRSYLESPPSDVVGGLVDDVHQECGQVSHK